MIELFNQKRSEHICFLLSNYHSSLGRAAKTIKGTNQVRRCLDKRDWLVSLARSCFISVVQVEGEPAGSEEIHPLSSLQWLRNKKKRRKKTSATGTACPSEASFSIWDAVWKLVDYTQSMNSLCSEVFWVMWQGLLSSLCFSALKRLLWKLHTRWGSRRLAGGTACARHSWFRSELIASFVTLSCDQRKAKTWQLAFEGAGMSRLKPGLNADCSRLRRRFTSPGGFYKTEMSKGKCWRVLYGLPSGLSQSSTDGPSPRAS